MQQRVLQAAEKKKFWPVKKKFFQDALYCAHDIWKKSTNQKFVEDHNNYWVGEKKVQ